LLIPARLRLNVYRCLPLLSPCLLLSSSFNLWLAAFDIPAAPILLWGLPLGLRLCNHLLTLLPAAILHLRHPLDLGHLNTRLLLRGWLASPTSVSVALAATTTAHLRSATAAISTTVAASITTTVSASVTATAAMSLALSKRSERESSDQQ